MSVAVDLLVEAGDWPPRQKLRRIAARAVEAAAAGAADRLPPETEVSVVFTDDAHIRGLNRTYRKKDKPTNVLSFPAAPPRNGLYGPLLGDIFLAAETIWREAEAAKVAPEDHLTHLIVHGFLHLAGHDHEAVTEARLMEGLEVAILAGLGVADPYAERAKNGRR